MVRDSICGLVGRLMCVFGWHKWYRLECGYEACSRCHTMEWII